MIVLALGTSTSSGSVAVVDGDRVLAEVTHDDPRGHAEQLFNLVDAALATARIDRARVDLVACDIGPGSFTGVRIAVASAKGVALGLAAPLAGVVSLEAMAAAARASSPAEALIAAAIDAKKDELYLAVYDGERALLDPCHVARASAAEHVARAVSGRPFVSIVDDPAFTAFAGPLAAAALVEHPRASWIGRIAAARARDLPCPLGTSLHALLDPESVVPLYVRAPDAVQMIALSP